MKQSKVVSSVNGVPSKCTLSNGLRVFVDADARFHTASVAICILGGLRSESVAQVGVTHLLEHVLFKRTATRSPLQIATSLDLLGGAVNGFTDAEMLCLHADVPGKRIAEVVELFADMLLAPSFTAEDFETERDVVRQEMLELIDDPSDSAYRAFCEAFWPNSMLALPVCGTEESLAALSPEVVRTHLKNLLVGSRILIGFAGGVDPEVCRALAEQCFVHLPAGGAAQPLKPNYGNGLVTTVRPVSQVHFIIGTPWPHLTHPQQTASEAIVSVLGQGMSSRLFQRLREERGLVYDIDCSAESFTDTAAFEIAGVVDRNNLADALGIIQKELREIREQGVSAEELAHIRAVVEAELLMELDSPDAKMWRAIESELLYGRYITSEEDYAALCAVTQQDCQQVVASYLTPGNFVASFAGEVGNLKINEELRRWCSTFQ